MALHQGTGKPSMAFDGQRGIERSLCRPVASGPFSMPVTSKSKPRRKAPWARLESWPPGLARPVGFHICPRQLKKVQADRRRVKNDCGVCAPVPAETTVSARPRGGRTTIRPAERPGPPRASMAPTLTVNQCGGGERLGERRPLPRAQFKSSFVSEEEQERKGLPRRVAY